MVRVPRLFVVPKSIPITLGAFLSAGMAATQPAQALANLPRNSAQTRPARLKLSKRDGVMQGPKMLHFPLSALGETSCVLERTLEPR